MVCNLRLLILSLILNPKGRSVSGGDVFKKTPLQKHLMVYSRDKTMDLKRVLGSFLTVSGSRACAGMRDWLELELF